MTEAFALPHNRLSRVKEAFSAALRFVAAHSAGAACAREADRLSALTDDELARLGLTRDRIVHHAFSRHLL